MQRQPHQRKRKHPWNRLQRGGISSNELCTHTVFLSKIPSGSKPGDLWDALEMFGALEISWVQPGKSFGFVRFVEAKSAKEAVETKYAQIKSRKVSIYYARKSSRAPVIYCDLDGVLCDFLKRATEIIGKSPNDVDKKDGKELFEMWEKLKNSDSFYANLPWMPEGKRLWSKIKHLNPIILSGVPRGKWATPQKLDWVQKNLGEEVRLITCFAPVKPRYCHSRPPSILIDDSDKTGAGWESKGGIYIHHKNIETTLAALKDYGVIGSNDIKLEKAMIVDITSSSKPNSGADEKKLQCDSSRKGEPKELEKHNDEKKLDQQGSKIELGEAKL
mmetsp:Transcript_13904/g.21008  ORF Transcript_13904/g.21008 Transcript_13904/m.21008 type:complete len:331 (+) Transcript_13904:87-1079(+)